MSVGPAPEPQITRQEFEEFFMDQARLTREELERYIVIEQCDDYRCEDPECLGWATIPRTAWLREKRQARNPS